MGLKLYYNIGHESEKRETKNITEQIFLIGRKLSLHIIRAKNEENCSHNQEIDYKYRHGILSYTALIHFLIWINLN